VGGNPDRTAHRRRKEIFIKRPTQPQAVRLCPALPRAFRARRASLRSSVRRESSGSGPELTWGTRATLPLSPEPPLLFLVGSSYRDSPEQTVSSRFLG
jgi:hypothetical protein